MSSKTTKMVYAFGGGSAEGNATMRELLGGKGANLAEMASLGIPVPPGFTITTEVCNDFLRRGGKMSPGLKSQVMKKLKQVEKIMDFPLCLRM